jgi:hypothetical protein
MNCGSPRNHVFDVIDNISRLKLLSQAAGTLGRAVGECGYSSWGINGLLPPAAQDAHPLILTETALGASPLGKTRRHVADDRAARASPFAPRRARPFEPTP